MSGVRQRPLAASDISEIWDYIAEDSIAQADKWVDRLNEILSLIASQPKMGRTRDEVVDSLRSHPFGRYVVFYMPVDDGIDVIRVLHSARDIAALFGDP